jgi:hypothetical protein
VLSHTSPSSSRKPEETNRVAKRQRSQPGAGLARIWAVSSTVGVQAIGSRALKTVGGNASTAHKRARLSTGSAARKPEPASHQRLPGLAPCGEGGVVGMQAQIDLAHERGREGAGRLHADAVLGCGQFGRRALDELGSFGLRQIAERPEHGQQRAGTENIVAVPVAKRFPSLRIWVTIRTRPAGQGTGSAR